MKKLMAAVLGLAIVATSGAAFAQPEDGDLGIVFDPNTLATTTTVPGFATFNVYVVTYGIGDISAWESGLSKDPSFSILSVTFSEGSALNIGNTSNYIVGLGGCFNYGTGIKTLATINGGYFVAPTAPELVFCLTPSSPASIQGTTAYVDCSDNLLAFGVMNSNDSPYGDGCAVANATGEEPVATEKGSMGALKASF